MEVVLQFYLPETIQSSIARSLVTWPECPVVAFLMVMDMKIAERIFQFLKTAHFKENKRGKGVSYISEITIAFVLVITITKGGGMFIRGCNTTVKNTVFSYNQVIGLGGSLMVDAASGETILDSLNINNSQSDRHGGGISITGGNVIITNSIVQDNIASNNGGGVYVRGTKGWILKVDMINTTVANNQVFLKNKHLRKIYLFFFFYELRIAAQGGGMSVESNLNIYNWSAEPEVTLTGVTVLQNIGDTYGGGIFIEKGSLKTFGCIFDKNQAKNGSGLYYDSGWYQDYQSLFKQNVASAVGGGMYAKDVDMGLTNTKLLRNNAKYGGGLFMERCLLRNSTNLNFSQNVAKYSGGAVQVPSNCQWCVNCNFQSNTAAFGQDQSTGPKRMEVCV
ncbi:putative extracellular nuclease [Reticulomyxa filosa]|uniref:Putative extracellular nuclease n=1 Tax=Reticulomyxa filosa TaxID=46433 RepID=X6NVI6_RETFI|nr:putative extracellular nuclease [Reticulomyxa filosa]|eukprot:ETO30021.1 putative extracellular nuclease [Reticulomyxa filosa]